MGRKTSEVEKGNPDFSNLDLKHIREYKFMLTDLMGNYDGCAELETLRKVYDDLLAEDLKLLGKEKIVSVVEEKVKEPMQKTKLLKSRPLVKSPLRK